jgi:hypothetical protein
MEDRQPPVVILVHAHRSAHEMRSQRAGWDLQSKPTPFDGVVVAGAALLLEAEDFVGCTGAVGDESGSRLLGRHREGGIVGWQVALGDPAVGRRKADRAGQGQLLGQAILEGSESALGTAARFGRVRSNVADAKLGQRPANLSLNRGTWRRR